ncbi:unnamed protein product [Rhizopus stolonifer]
MFPNKQTPPVSVNDDGIYVGAEARNVKSSRAQAPDVESESEEEHQQAKKNFSEEDKQVCRSYLLITLDAVHGTEQKGETFWSRVEENYKQATGTSYFESHARALPTRCGSNDESNEGKAKQIYKAKVKANFNLMHYKKKNKRKGKATTANTIASCATAAAEEDEVDNVGPSTCPAGIKQVKANEAVKRKRSDQRDTIIRNQKELIRHENERSKLMKEALKVSQEITDTTL